MVQLEKKIWKIRQSVFGVDKEEFDWQVFLVLSFDSQYVAETGLNSKLTRIEGNGRQSEPKN